jgi:hypothetical protein
LNNSRDKREALHERPRQQRALGKSGAARNQCDTQLAARRAVAKIEITEVAAVVALVVGHDTQLDNLFLEILRNLIDRRWMHRARRDVDHAMTVRHVEPQSDLIAVAPRHQLHPRSVA